MDYGFWFLLADGAGHTSNFQGWFDQIMDFFFYIPNLIIVELLIRGRNIASSSMMKMLTSIVLLLATGFLVLATYFFTVHQWAPAIFSAMGM